MNRACRCAGSRLQTKGRPYNLGCIPPGHSVALAQPQPAQRILQGTIYPSLFWNVTAGKTREEPRLFWKASHCFDMFWTMLSHSTLSVIPSSLSACVEVARAKAECLKLYKQVCGPFTMLDSVTDFCFQKRKKENKCMLNILWMKDLCIVKYCTENCCVMRLYPFSKDLVCSQHCVFSASLWLCKYEEDIKHKL